MRSILVKGLNLFAIWSSFPFACSDVESATFSVSGSSFESILAEYKCCHRQGFYKAPVTGMCPEEYGRSCIICVADQVSKHHISAAHAVLAAVRRAAWEDRRLIRHQRSGPAREETPTYRSHRQSRRHSVLT